MSGPTRFPRLRRPLASGLLLAAVATTAAVVAPAAAAAPSAVIAPRAAASSAAPGPGGPPPKPGQIIWSAAPANAQGLDHRAKYVYNDIAPGSVIHDYVAVVNRSLANVSFLVYATDATGTTAQNVLTWLEVGDKPKDIGRWETFQLGKQLTPTLSVSIGGQKGLLVPFTIKVPTFATPGDHTGAIMAQVGIPRQASKSSSVIVYNRIAVPIELRVKGPYHTGLQVQSVSTSFSNSLNPFGSGSAIVSYTVANTGNVRLAGSDLVNVTGPFGMKAQGMAPRLPVILPGDSVRMTAIAPGLYPAGPMSAHVAVQPGWARDEQAIPALTLAASHSDASLFAVPWSLIGVILLLIAIGGGAWYFLRWRRRQQVAEVTEAVARARREAESRLAARRQPVGVGAPPPVGSASTSAAASDPAQSPSPGDTALAGSGSQGTESEGTAPEGSTPEGSGASSENGAASTADAPADGGNGPDGESTAE